MSCEAVVEKRLSRPVARQRRRAGPARLLWRARLRVRCAHYAVLDVHLGWLLTLVGVTWLLAQTLFPRLFPGWMPAAYWVVATSVALTDCLAGLLHELGHTLAAMAKGKHVYRIALYGLAASVRRSSGHLRPRDQLAIAVAGPISHLLIGSLLWTAWQLLPDDNEPLRVATAFPAASNLAAGVFNLLPIQPLDGGRAARALVAATFRA
jgi:stage IV sporulation protein FB